MQIFLHVPGAGWAALGAEPAMQAHILVLGHDAAGLETVGDIKVLRQIVRRGAQSLLEGPASSPFCGEGDAVHRADVDAGVAFDA